MKKQIMSVRDSVSEVFFQPFFAVNVASGIRDFNNGCRDGSAQNAVDLALYLVGEFDDVSGVVTPLDPVRVASGLEVSKEVK